MVRKFLRRYDICLTSLLLLPIACIGCGRDRLPLAPVEGKVTYQNEPLSFGSVMFQPDHGPPARGKIGPDGTFCLSTYSLGDGAVLGSHQVRITCLESQRPAKATMANAEDGPADRSYIPEKYSLFPTSGLTVTVNEMNEPFIFKLK